MCSQIDHWFTEDHKFKKITNLWKRSYNGFLKFINSLKNVSKRIFTNATHTSNIIFQFPKESSFFSTHVLTAGAQQSGFKVGWLTSTTWKSFPESILSWARSFKSDRVTYIVSILQHIELHLVMQKLKLDIFEWESRLWRSCCKSHLAPSGNNLKLYIPSSESITFFCKEGPYLPVLSTRHTIPISMTLLEITNEREDRMQLHSSYWTWWS